MVKVNKFQKVSPQEEPGSYLLEVSDGVDFLTCLRTGLQTMVPRKCQVLVSQEQIDAITRIEPGKKIAGYLVKVKTAPYQYFQISTSKKLMFDYAFAYQPRSGAPEIGLTLVGQIKD